MLILWKFSRPMKTSEIYEALRNRKDWSISTMQALLARLEQAGEKAKGD